MKHACVSALPNDLAEAMKSSGVWREGCPVALDRLSLIEISYVDFDGQEHNDGQLIVLDAVAKYVASVFAILYKTRFAISKIRSIHHYSGDDERSMADNNTSCFNFRPIARDASIISMHSYGLAVDLNPRENPFVVFDEENGTATVHPKQGWQFLNRHNHKPGMVEELVSLWAENGFFVWGGQWTTPIDYQHFQPPRGVAELLAAMDKDDAQNFFDQCIKHRDQLKTMPSGKKLQPLIELYKNSRNQFFGSCWQLLT